MVHETDVLIRFGTRLRELRKSQGFSQESFAAQCELDRTYVGGIERGERNVALKNIEVLAKTLGLSISDLMDGLQGQLTVLNQEQFRIAYRSIRAHCSQDWRSIDTRDCIFDLARLSLQFLNSQCSAINLVSLVPGKSYMTYSLNNVIARPANSRLFIKDVDIVTELWTSWTEGDIKGADFARMSYTVALAPCLAMELFDRGNKKGPATYFEWYIGHLFAAAFNLNPVKRAVLPVAGRSVLMTMDFLFDIGARKIHLPVKMSTRERVVQAWSHQRLLDAAYGRGKYQGIMVLFSETKLDSRSREVVEICLPDQWLAYQTLLSKMDRIYYFDIPERYEKLTQDFPHVIQIKQFGEFFNEVASMRRTPRVRPQIGQNKSG